MSEPREWVLNQPDDPGPVGAGMIWVNPATEPPTVQVRKSDNSGWDAIGGGGSSSVGDFYLTNAQSVPNVALTALNWTYNSGPELLDLTNPAFPTVKKAGIYAVTHTVNSEYTDSSGDEVLRYQLTLDNSGVGVLAEMTVPLHTDITTPHGSLAITFYVPLGGVILAQVKQDSGSAINIDSWASVQFIG